MKLLKITKVSRCGHFFTCNVFTLGEQLANDLKLGSLNQLVKEMEALSPTQQDRDWFHTPYKVTVTKEQS
tara:strand:- start:683 stop:892 length:210 start_codon:yes stop_codon:yes gene_type:complete